MARTFRSAVLLHLFLLATPAAAAPFVNLNFEQATVPPGSPPVIPAAVGVPGWTPRVGNLVVSSVAYNSTGIGDGRVVLYDAFLGIGIGVVEPRFSICLITDFGFDLPASLSQLGEVPEGTKSLRFLADYFRPPALLSIDGTNLPLVQLSQPSNFEPVEWGADLTAFAGQTVELRVSSGLPPSRIVTVDALSFSSSPIPEPNSTSAIGIAAILTARRRGRSPAQPGMGTDHAWKNNTNVHCRRA